MSVNERAQGTRLRVHAQWVVLVGVHVVKRHAIVDVLCHAVVNVVIGVHIVVLSVPLIVVHFVVLILLVILYQFIQLFSVAILSHKFFHNIFTAF